MRPSVKDSFDLKKRDYVRDLDNFSQGWWVVLDIPTHSLAHSLFHSKSLELDFENSIFQASFTHLGLYFSGEKDGYFPTLTAPHQFKSLILGFEGRAIQIF